MTSDLWSRVLQHKSGQFDGFSKTHRCTRLVWYQPFELVTSAIKREKTMKGWPRVWKLNVIDAANPEWLDLADEVVNRGVEGGAAGFPEQVRE